MEIADLRKVADTVGLFNDLCGEREIKLAYNLSKQPIVDEVSDESTLKMQYVEFLEAFARIAEKSALPRFTNVISFLCFFIYTFKTKRWNPYSMKDFRGRETRKSQPLHLKIESAI
jgi:hypothetical protein